MTRKHALNLMNWWAADFQTSIIPEEAVKKVIRTLAESEEEQKELLSAWCIGD